MSEEMTDFSETYAEKLKKIYDNTVALYDGWAKGIRDIIQGDCSSIVIPAGTKKIRDYAFYNCVGFEDVVIPDSVKSIGSHAFYGCVGLESVTIYEGVTKIGNSAFANCSSLTSVIIPDSVSSIGSGAFAGCTGIKVYDFSRCKDIPSVGQNAFYVNDGVQIRVPDDLYAQWVDTWWKSGSDYSEYIVPYTPKAAPDESKFNIFAPAVGKESLESILNFSFLGKKLTVGVGKYEVLYENEVPYLRIYGDGSSPEAYATVPNIEGKKTGKYLVFAYRLPPTNAEYHGFFQIYTNTTGDGYTGNGDLVDVLTEQDGRWHVAIIDLEAAIASSPKVRTGTCASRFVANSDGTYTIQKLRIDWFNQKTSVDSYVDVAYIGTCNTIEDARAADADYNGLALMPDDFVARLGSTAVKGSYNGMEYVTITDTTISGGEKHFEFRNQEQVTLGTSRFAGVLYRNAPGGYAEVFISSSTLLTDAWATNRQMTYDTSAGWHFGIIDLSTDPDYKDGVCRRLRFDYFNGLAVATQYTIDIAFVKFFSSAADASDYCEAYMTKYGLNQEETI